MKKDDHKLAQTRIDSKIELGSIREGFGQGLLMAGQADKNVVALCADLSESTHVEAFKNKFPDRFVEIGVAEQNLVTVASGMAAMGKIPFAASYAIFSPGRNWEQIRTTVCYNGLPVKIIGSHAGITVGPDGGSHQALEDIALMRSLPRMVVISPCDAIEAKKATIAAAKTKDPTYIRLARDKTPIITREDSSFAIGKAQIIFRSALISVPHHRIHVQINNNAATVQIVGGVGIIATGPCLSRAISVARKLESEGKRVAVMNLSTIKPLDSEAIIKLAHDMKSIVTVEDHQIHGGMGSAVAECLGANYPVPIEFIGVKDKFGQSGTPEELIELYEIGEKHIYAAAQKVMLRRQ